MRRSCKDEEHREEILVPSSCGIIRDMTGHDTTTLVAYSVIAH